VCQTDKHNGLHKFFSRKRYGMDKSFLENMGKGKSKKKV
jgi:hypothetical protein